ncbi:RHS repeat domain-containing protein [Agromyces aerolatus]|uniref:RHS repeat domain-containing protein n=1 Tax=Agromyces sp. LY-1074 TaxID=3074080 RepID=UPI00285EB320|nr:MULTISPECIES: RHS repeat-associated core domain-containing protein [unclassified Agromyces]MDR5700167.1 RHS repeat-associated core domain-containing protein [Agromyces sp. LY-1074]MDR5706465.1 RHS repeat-associated core domain-containing protein [Agromyces sp. LY-1358]
MVGDFALGDGLEGLLDPRDGSFGFTVVVDGLTARWDSRAAGSDPHGLGPGWAWDMGRIDVPGGIQVRPASGRGVFQPDPAHPSGLAGYGLTDVVFEQVEGSLQPRATGVPGDRAPRGPVGYRFLLHELGGVTTYFDADGDPVARIGAHGARQDWLWHAHVPRRLIGVIDADGIATTLDWDTDPRAVFIERAAGLAATPKGEGVSDAGARGAAWRVELDTGHVAAIVDPSAGRTSIGTDERTGLVAAIAGPSGGTTRVSWSTGRDGVPRAGRVSVTDASGAVMTAREWAPVGEKLSSGWPVHAGEDALLRSSDSAFRFRTTISDGATDVISEFNSLHLLVGRRMIAASASGQRVLQEHAFTYPGTEGGGVARPAALPVNWSRPTAVEVIHRAPDGGSRTSRESTVFDELGRLISRTAADGTLTETEYDRVVPEGSKLPIGLVVAETVRVPDGQVGVTRRTLDDARRSVTATDVVSMRHDGAVPLVIARDEFEIAPDGRVTEQRAFPSGDRAEAPVVTRWRYEVDPVAGTETGTETAAVGTPAESSSRRQVSLVSGGLLAATDPLGNVSRSRYDRLGRVTRDADGTSYDYDALNRPIAETRADGTAVTVEYWVDGTRRRLTRTDDPAGSRSETTFYWDGGALANEVHRGDAAGEVSYLFGNARHARTVVDADGTTSTAFLVTDRHGSVTELTDADGGVTERYRYSDYGVPLTEHAWAGLRGNPFGYAGEYTHPSGSQHLSSRSYDPATGRFTTLDTAELHNRYAYADANPITRVDPTGRAGLDDFGHWALAAFGIAVGVGTAIASAVTAGATVPVLGMFAATIFDAFVTVATTVNDQHVEFMQASVGAVVGFAATAASLVTAKWVGGLIGRKRPAPAAIELEHLGNLERRAHAEQRAASYEQMLAELERERARLVQAAEYQTSALTLMPLTAYHIRAYIGFWSAIGTDARLLAKRTHRLERRMSATSSGGLWRELTATARGIPIPDDVVWQIRRHVLTSNSGVELELDHMSVQGVLDDGREILARMVPVLSQAEDAHIRSLSTFASNVEAALSEHAAEVSQLDPLIRFALRFG